MRIGHKIATVERMHLITSIFGMMGIVVILTHPTSAVSDGIWRFVEEGSLKIQPTGLDIRWVEPSRFEAVEVNSSALWTVLNSATDESLALEDAQGTILPLPTPDGDLLMFEVWESPIMEEGLSEWLTAQGWPMRTYAGICREQPGTGVRFDYGGPGGFHGRVMGPSGTYQIDPLWKHNHSVYAVYYAEDYPRQSDDFDCLVTDRLTPTDAIAGDLLEVNTLKRFRTAVAATGEYTQFHGGTKALGQAAIVTTINRVNQIYERDLSVRLILVANNQDVVYTSSSTDPYTNGNLSQMLTQNQSNLDSVIGSANYDIGHIFGTNSGGLAYLGVVCVANYKARGGTGSSAPIGDPFDIDYVAHEMGHQFGANHCFDGTNGSCSGGNRNDATAFEPGSGSTVMCYAGICGADDLQPNSDDHFHAVSLNEIQNYLNTISCFSTITNGNLAYPTISAGADYTIPANTPFELNILSSSDADGDTLTYCWEQWNLSAGTSGDPLSAGDQGDNPIIRSWPPSADPIRIVPRLQNLLNNTTAPGEILPTTSRAMQFRITVRDNHAAGGLTRYDTMVVTSTTAAGPFTVVYPNGGESVANSMTVTWNVAGTTAAPVSATQVDILLSVNGGSSFPYLLADNTDNDGSQVVAVSAPATSTARIKIQAASNIFFDISNGNFTITASAPTATPTPSTPLPTATRSPTPTITPTRTPTRTMTRSPTSSPTRTPTITPSPSSTATVPPTSTMTNTPTLTPTWTNTDTPTLSPTRTPRKTSTPTATPSPTRTSTVTLTPTIEPTLPSTVTPTPAVTSTPQCLHTGDSNIDNDLSSSDAQLAFMIAIGVVTPTLEEACAADCNADDNVTAGDAQQIFQAVLGVGTCVDPL